MKRFMKSIMPAAAWQALSRIRSHYIYYRYQRNIKYYSRRVVRHKYGDDEFQILIADPSGESWYDRDWQKLPEITLLSTSRLRSGATVFNIGAHQGLIALMLARAVSPSGKVVAVDPHPVNIELIRENAILNEQHMIQTIQAAVGEVSGTAHFGGHLNDRLAISSDDMSIGMDVRVVCMDDLCNEHGNPDVVFLDVEGFEWSVLQGARRLIEVGHTDWFVEVHVNTGLEAFGKSAAEVLAFFPDDRFNLFVASESLRDFVKKEDRPDLQLDRFFLVAIPKN